jgi:hypothetical protein
MIGNVGPGQSCCEHTLNTLRYADRVKELKKDNRDAANALMLPRQGGKSTIEYIKKQDLDIQADLDFLKKKNPAGALLARNKTMQDEY